MLTTMQKRENREFLVLARIQMLMLLRGHPEGLGMDDIRRHCERCGLKPNNTALWGNVVRDKRFKRNGDRRSKRETSHGRWISIWKLSR